VEQPRDPPHKDKALAAIISGAASRHATTPRARRPL